MSTPRTAAVAAILRSAPAAADGAGAALELLLIRRAEREGDVWSGHIALPGGHSEPQDHDAVATAVRETMEEIGVDLSAPGATLLGALPALGPLSPQLPALTVLPFVWHVAHAEPGTSDEVAATYWVPLAQLRSDEYRTQHVLHIADGTERTFPAISIGGDVPLWGMTHRIVETLLEAVDRGA